MVNIIFMQHWQEPRSGFDYSSLWNFWEVMNSWLSKYTQMTILYKPVKNPDADQFVRDAQS